MRVLCRSTMAVLLACLWLAPPALAQSPPGGSALTRDAANAALPAARNDLGFVNYVSILDPAFGAKCDGATDDAAAIQAAVNAVPQYGVLLTPTGKTCNFNSTITIQRQISFRSDGGPGGTQFFWGGNATDDHIVVSNRTGPFQAGAVR